MISEGMRNHFFLIILTFLFSINVHARPVVVFDLDHTLINTNYRILAIMREIGRKEGLAELSSMQYVQVEALKTALKKGDMTKFTEFGLRDPQIIKKVFGDGTNAGLKKSAFGKMFYENPRLLNYDGVIPGSQEFVKKIASALDADILYLTGRTEKFRRATLKQLVRYGFPDGKLILKPNNYRRSTEEYKAEILSRYQVIIIFDDSKRNMRKFRETLPSETILVHITPEITYTQALMNRLILQAQCAALLLGF